MSLTKQNTRKLISIVVGLAVIFALALLLGTLAHEAKLTVAAAGVASPSNATPTSTAITGVSADKASAYRGDTVTLTATVSVGTPTDNAGVWTWTSSSANSTVTKDNTNDKKATLLIGANETNKTITITAKLGNGSTKTATVNVAASSITINPASATVARGGSTTFTATIKKGYDWETKVGSSTAGTWGWSAGNSSNTKFGADSLGVQTLVVGADEGKPTIDVWCDYGTLRGTTTVTVTSSGGGSTPPAGWLPSPSTGGTIVVEAPVVPFSDPDKAKADVDFEIKDGVMVLTFKADDIDLSKLGDDDNVVIKVEEWGNIELPIPAAILEALGDKDLEIQTGFGAIVIPNSLLTAWGGDVTIVIKYGSLTIEVYGKDGKLVSDFAEPMSITIPYTLKDGEKAENVVAFKVNGAYYPLGIYNGKEIAFEVTSSGTYNAKYNKVEFDDVADHWAAEYVNFVTARGIFAGTGDFNADEKLTRAMFAAELAKLDGVDLSKYTESTFEDIAADAAYLGAVEWAVENKIINGKVEGKEFGPDDFVTREQMATMFVRYLDAKGIKLEAVVDAVEFTDADDISAYAADAVEIMQTAGIMEGKVKNEVYGPQDDATKAEIATIFARFIQAVNK